jgi:hypothetical protein
MTYTARQQKILEWLSKDHPHSSKLFEAAIRLTPDTDLPCCDRFVAHAYREICSDLLNTHSSNHREEKDPILDRLSKELGSLSFTSASPATPGTDTVAVTDTTFPVPSSIMDLVSSLVRIHVAAPKGKDRAHDLFRGMALNRKAVISGVSQTADRWFKMYNYFVGRAHDRTTDAAAMMGKDFRRHVEFFEETLLSLAMPAIDNLNALDDILASANG